MMKTDTVRYLHIDMGGGVMSQMTKMHSVESLAAKVFVNGKEIVGNDKAILINHEANEIRLETDSPDVKEFRLGLADSGGQNFTAEPNFDESVELSDGACLWKVTPDGSDDTPVTLAAYTPDVEAPVTLKCKVSDINFRFLYLTGQVIPYPPKMVPIHTGVLYSSGVMITSQGQPLVDTIIAFHIPDHEVCYVATGPKGQASMIPVIFSTPGVKKLRAVAMLPSGEVSVEMLADAQTPP